MKKFLLVLVTLSNCSLVYGQICGTPVPLNATNYVVNNGVNAKVLAPITTSVCPINVFFHIVRNTDGSNAFTAANLDDIVTTLNGVYNPHGIFINNIGFVFINNTDFVNIDSQNEATLLGQTNNRIDAINYYIVESLWNVNGGTVIGTANSIPSNNLVIRNDATLTSTSSHEFGHCLNLYHTFETSFGAENLNGSNCLTAGDLICDTPADQGLGKVNGYSPDLTNIMSYYENSDHFTNEQGQRMQTALSIEPVLQKISTASFNNETWSSDEQIEACGSISMTNIKIDQDAVITIISGGELIIQGTFEAEVGVMLDIK